MIKTGEIQKLRIVKKVDFGVYLSGDPVEQGAQSSTGAGDPAGRGGTEERVLLPKKQVPEGAEPGDELEVFIYLDSKDRKIATVRKPLITLGSFALLTVREVTKMGAFLDMGLERDLLLPFREQTYTPNAGGKVLVKMYLDKTGRLAASMKVYDSLLLSSPYTRDDEVEGLVYEISRRFGAFVAVDYKYSALIPAKELTEEFKPGDIIHARVSLVKEDGKLDLSVHKKAWLQMEDDAKKLEEMMKANRGLLDISEKSEPWLIKKRAGMSKAAFKRAIGRLLKERRITIDEEGIIRLR